MKTTNAMVTHTGDNGATIAHLNAPFLITYQRRKLRDFFFLFLGTAVTEPFLEGNTDSNNKKNTPLSIAAVADEIKITQFTLRVPLKREEDDEEINLPKRKRELAKLEIAGRYWDAAVRSSTLWENVKKRRKINLFHLLCAPIGLPHCSHNSPPPHRCASCCQTSGKCVFEIEKLLLQANHHGNRASNNHNNNNNS